MNIIKNVNTAVDLILDQKPLVIFQGPSEWGPRALGNRSILFDPRNKDANNIVNKFKNRENMKNLDLTQLEKEVIEIISGGDEFEEMPTEGFENIMNSFKGTKNQLKGVLGSLEKKEIICMGEFPNGKNAYHLDI